MFSEVLKELMASLVLSLLLWAKVATTDIDNAVMLSGNLASWLIGHQAVLAAVASV